MLTSSGLCNRTEARAGVVKGQDTVIRFSIICSVHKRTANFFPITYKQAFRNKVGRVFSLRLLLCRYDTGKMAAIVEDSQSTHFLWRPLVGTGVDGEVSRACHDLASPPAETDMGSPECWQGFDSEIRERDTVCHVPMTLHGRGFVHLRHI